MSFFTRNSKVDPATELDAVGLREFTTYLRSPWRIVWTNLLAGIARGLGFVLGATVVLTGLVFILVQILGGLPVVGEQFQAAGQFFREIQAASQQLQAVGVTGR